MSSPSETPIEVSCRQVQAKLGSHQPPVLLDCRERDEYDLVRIADSRLLPMSGIQERVSELEDERDNEIVVYCHHGARSLQVALWLRQLGFSRASSMSGGIDQWAAEIDKSLARY